MESRDLRGEGHMLISLILYIWERLRLSVVIEEQTHIQKFQTVLQASLSAAAQITMAFTIYHLE